MLFAKGRYKGDLEGGTNLDYLIEVVNSDSITNGTLTSDREFERALKYDITRTIVNILSNATITYAGQSDKFCLSLQKNLVDLFYELHEKGKTFLRLDADRQIVEVSSTNRNGSVEIVDKAYEISKITQKKAVEKALEMYGVVTNTMYSVLDERGMLGVFSPAKDTVIKPSQTDKIYEAFRKLFGTKKGQRKFAIVDVPLTYSGVNIQVKDMELLANKKDAVASVARLFGIQEDMILSGSTFDNKENAIIQTYTDYKGLIYSYINQIESQIISLNRNIENYNVTFPGVPQMNKKPETTTI